jgi:hypothetical protein
LAALLLQNLPLYALRARGRTPGSTRRSSIFR